MRLFIAFVLTLTTALAIADDSCKLTDTDIKFVDRQLDNNKSFGIILPNAKSVTLCNIMFPVDFVLTKDDAEQIAPDYLHAFYHGIIYHPEFIGVVKFNPSKECFDSRGKFDGYEMLQCSKYAP